MNAEIESLLFELHDSIRAMQREMLDGFSDLNHRMECLDQRMAATEQRIDGRVT